MNSQSRFKLNVLLLPILLLAALAVPQTLSRQPHVNEATGGQKKPVASENLFPLGLAAQALEKKEKADFEECLDAFKEAASYYFSETRDSKARRQLLDLMCATQEKLTRDARKITKMRCPHNWTECHDGTCVRSPKKCGSKKS
jgi:hypothetical protein